MKKIIHFMLALVLILTTGIGGAIKADASGNDNSDSINEKLGLPIVVYGETLTEVQKQEVRKALKVDDPANVEEIIVTAQDLARLINGNPNSRMFSSAKITLKDDGHGIVTKIVTPDLITEVTEEMYANAMLTAGIENADVEVASPVKVSGHSALVGIYKAFESKGVELDKGRMEVANDELDLATDLAQKEGMDDQKVTELLTEIKKQIADQNPVTREEVEKIVEDQLKKMNISLSPEDRQLLIDLFERMRSLNINFDNVKQQLNDLTKDLKEKMGNVINDEGFWDSVANFFKKLIDSIAGLFK